MKQIFASPGALPLSGAASEDLPDRFKIGVNRTSVFLLAFVGAFVMNSDDPLVEIADGWDTRLERRFPASLLFGPFGNVPAA
jgi:hypothetical protein